MGLRVLLVEDDPDVRFAVASALGEAKHDVVEVGDGAAALERLASQSFDVVVSDIRLPGVDGLAVFRRAREVAPRTAVILMTSFGAVADAVAALKQGAHDYITKPFDTLPISAQSDLLRLLFAGELASRARWSATSCGSSRPRLAPSRA